jgi:hypothetical protein
MPAGVTVHLVYPHGNRISSPDAIGRHLGGALAERYDVRLYDWADTTRIIPAPGDVLIGHPHPAPWTVFRRSARESGWRRVIAMSPFNGDPLQMAWIDPIVGSCDIYLAITGCYWFKRVRETPFSHWQPKLIHLDLAVDRVEFPSVKMDFNPPGRRRFVYIGHSGWPKSTQYLSEIARLLPAQTEFAWIGNGAPIEQLRALGHYDFREARGRELIAGYDFTITAAAADSNPATILESMAWGLIPICNPESGYERYESIPNIPLNDAAGAARILANLLEATDAQLCAWREENWRLLDQHFNWHRFTANVVDAIESSERPPLGPRTAERRLALRLAAWRSPFGPFRGYVVRHAVRLILDRGRRLVRRSVRPG